MWLYTDWDMTDKPECRIFATIVNEMRPEGG